MQRLLEIARTGEILTLAAPIILAILADHHSRDTSREKVSADLLKHSRPLFALLSPEDQRAGLTSHFSAFRGSFTAMRLSDYKRPGYNFFEDVE